MASSCRWFCAAASSASCFAWTSCSRCSNSLMRCCSSLPRLLASASSVEDLFFAPLDASALARADFKFCSSSFRLASDSSSFCCSFRTERSSFSAAFTCGASSSDCPERRCISSSRAVKRFRRASKAASRSAASRPSGARQAAFLTSTLATSACTVRSRSAACACSTRARSAPPRQVAASGSASRFRSLLPLLAGGALAASDAPEASGVERRPPLTRARGPRPARPRLAASARTRSRR
mmetsp:Transcript_129721/g.361321  ORF Transcript_129721/g.361321 Transcript_129721/m.361321 type:complete len:238 (+) Transcript_129721:1664-2377(+)